MKYITQIHRWPDKFYSRQNIDSCPHLVAETDLKKHFFIPHETKNKIKHEIKNDEKINVLVFFSSCNNSD